MPFFTVDHLAQALKYLPEHTHPSLVSFLAMLKAQVPVSNQPTKPFGSAQETDLMRRYFAPAGENGPRPWYVPFGAQKEGGTNWKPRTYGGASLQRMRTGKDFIYVQGSGASNDLWALDQQYLTTLAQRGEEVVGKVPISIHHLATWMYRTDSFPQQQAAIDRFKAEFNLAQYQLVPSVFSDALDAGLNAIPLGNSPLSSEVILTLVDPPPVAQSASGLAPAQPTSTAAATPSPAVELDGDDYTWEVDAVALQAALGDLLGMEEAAFRAIAALRAGMHVIFTGPPGTGKTKLARKLCAATKIPFLMTAATDQWSTVDTIGGYFPSADGDGRLDFLPGFVVSAIASKKALIIDEINRADIDKAFGELFTLLSGNNVDLPYLRREEGGAGKRRRLRLVANASAPGEDGVECVTLPSWWRLIGSMNDADKASLKRLSYAFIRRFAFIPVPIPPADTYKKLIQSGAGSGADGLATTRQDYLATLEALFAEPTGLASIDMAMGFAIPEAMMRHARTEIAADAKRSTMDLLTSSLELYVSPQFQGRADKHEAFVKLISPLLDADHKKAFATGLAVWTGFIE